MGAEAMVDIPGWVTAVGTITPVVGAALTYFVLRPINKRIDVLKEAGDARHADLITRLNAQDAAAKDLRTTVDLKFDHLRDDFREHEKFDGERFDDAAEKVESQVSGLRRDMTQASDQQVSHLRQDIGALGQRIDGLVGKVVETLGTILAGRKGAAGGD